MIKNAFLACCILCTQLAFTQPKIKAIAKPKLVIGLVVDQMRWDFLYRYYDLFFGTGFKRLLNEGFSCDNTFINYLPTYTAPGHATIYTGSVPAIHGIIGNNWFDRTSGKTMYCSDDSTVAPVGPVTGGGKSSPRNLLSTTIADELRLSNNFKSKVFAVSIKDRASIFPAGHSGNAAFWYDESTGKWITSTYYMKELPAWLQKINAQNLPDSYMSKDWNTLLPIEKYGLSTEDNKTYEGLIGSDKSTTFPHKLSEITLRKYSAFQTTPFANTLTFDVAKSLIENEKLGRNSVTDFLAINIASTDFIGHAFGPNSIEIQDTYLRLDKDLSQFLQFLDRQIGKGNYLLFLSADHGVAHVPGFLQEHNLPGGLFSLSSLSKDLNQLLDKNFSLKKGVLNIQNYQVYLNTDEIENKTLPEVKQAVINYLLRQPYVSNAFETEKISIASIPEPIKTMAINGYNQKRSGDIHFVLKPGFFDRGNTGATHGSWNPYDTHIPLVWFGWNIKHGTTNRETYMTDIAPTIAAMLKIQMPSGNVGKVIGEVIK